MGRTVAALEPYESDIVKTLPPIEEMGPAMRALPERWRVFVMSCLTQIKGNHADAARVAGYNGDDDTLKVTGHRIAHDPRVQAALVEQARKHLQGGTVFATRKLFELMESANPKIALAAANSLLDRGGLPAVSQVNHKDVTPLSQEEKLALAVGLAERLGIDARAFLGDMGRVAAVVPAVVVPPIADVPRTPAKATGTEVISEQQQGDENV